MIHYHGTPITPATAAATVLAGRHAMVSFAHPEQLDIALGVCQSVALDNGAFSAWRSGSPVTDWRPYYEWVAASRFPSVDWAVIPDTIEGGEEQNDALLADWPHGAFGVPVWHLHEGLERLDRLTAAWPRVALGSSGPYSEPGNGSWWRRIGEAMAVVCDDTGRPRSRLHGLRLLDPEIVSRLPLASADSTNIARTVGIDQAWRGPKEPPTKAWRALVLAARIEAVQSPTRWTTPRQVPFALEVA